MPAVSVAAMAQGGSGTRASTASPTTVLGWVTVLDGEATLLRGRDRLALAEGVALLPDDIVDVPAASRLLRLEFADGLAFSMGPESSVLLAPRLPGDRAGARAYLAAGWLKADAPAGLKAAVATPAFDVTTGGGAVVMSVQPDASTVFSESGESLVRRPGTPMPPAQAVKAGEAASVGPTGGAPFEVTRRPTARFIAALPKAFLDTLPARAARFRDTPVQPRVLAPINYGDAQRWINGEPPLRKAYLPRWRPLERDPEFRRGLIAEMSAHPEWRPILFPPDASAPRLKP